MLPGTWVERRPRFKQPVDVSMLPAADVPLCELMDGSRTLVDLVMATRAWPAPPPVERIAQVIVELARAGLLEGEWADERRDARLFVRIEGPFHAGTAAGLLARAGTLAFVVAPFFGALAVAVYASERSLSLMPPGASPWTLIAALFVCLNVPPLARIAACLASGHPVDAVGVETGLLPRIGFEAAPPSNGVARRRSLWGLGAHALIAGVAAVAALAGGAAAADQTVALALFLFLFDLSPVVSGDGHVLASLWSRERDLRSRLLGFLDRRLLRRLFLGEPAAPGEDRLLVVACASVLWAVATLRAAAWLARQSATGLSLAVWGAGSPATRVLGLVLLVGFVAGVGVALVSMVVTPLRWAWTAGFRGEPVARAMLPLGIAAGLLASWAPPATAAGAHLVAALAALLLLANQARNIPGARLAWGYAGLMLCAAAEVVRTGHAGDFAFLELSIDVHVERAASLGLAVFGLAAVLEARRAAPGVLAWGAALTACAASALVAVLRPGAAVGALAAGLALAGALLMLATRARTPMRHFWAPFALGVASELAGHGLAALVLWIAALAAAGALFAVPMPMRRRPEGHRAGASPEAALRDAGVHMLASLLDTVRFFLGPGRAGTVARALAAALPPTFRLEGDRVTAEGDAPDAGTLAASLRAALAALEREIVSSAGRRFHARALALAAEGLYWLEWESVHAHLFAAREQPAGGAELVEELSRLPLFRALPAAQLAELVRVVRWERCGDGAVLARQGEPGDRFYVVCRGALDVLQQDARGREHTLAHLHPGDAFGELALLGEGVRTATVVARGPVELVSLARGDFERFLTDRAHATALIRHGAFLRRVPCIGTLPSRVISEIATRVERLHLVDRAALPAGERIWLVKEGALAAGDAALGPGDVVGLEPAPRAAWQARGEAELLALERAALADALARFVGSFDSLTDLAGRCATSGWEQA